MFKIFKYKKMYEETEKELNKLEIEFNNYKKSTEKNNNKFKSSIDLLTTASIAKDEKIKKLEITIAEKVEKLNATEIVKRSIAGRNGGLKKANNKMVAEKKEMLELINNLIKERQKLMKEKNSPTIEELKKYFNH